MKLLALVFLVGFALAAAVPVPSHDLSLKEDDLESMLVLGAEDDDVETDLGKGLRESLDKILEQIKEAVEHGKEVKLNLLHQLREIGGKMKKMKVDWGEKAKDILEEIKEKATGFFKRILDQLGLGQQYSDMHAETFMMLDDDDIKTEIGKKLKENLEEILAKLKDAVDHGKVVKEEYIEKLKEIRQKLKDMKEDFGDKAREIVEKIREKAKDSLKKILDRLGLGQQYSDMHAETFMMSDDGDGQTELGKKLQERFEEILEKIKEAVENGKAVKEDTLQKLKDIRQKLRDLKLDMGDQAKKILEKMKEKVGDYWKKILDRLGLDKQATDMHAETNGMEADGDGQTELGKKLQKHFEEIIEKIKDAIENGKGVKEDYLDKLKEIRRKLNEIHMDIGDHAKELLVKMKEKVSDYWKKILERLGIGATDMHAETNGVEADDDLQTELGKKLKKHFEEILEKIRDAIEHGKTVKEDHLEKMKEIREQLRDLGMDIGNKAKELVEKMKEKAGGYWKKILERLGLDSHATDMHAETNGMEADVLEQRSFAEIKERLRNLKDKIRDILGSENIQEKIREKIKEKIEELFGKGNELAKQLIDKLKDKGHGHKESLLEFIDRLYEGRVEKRSIKDAFEKIKNFFRERQMELKEKFAKFGQFVKERYAEALGKGKDKAENLKELARKFIKDGKDFSQEVLKEAEEFFKEYKEDLGTIYEDVRQKITEILNKKSK